VLWRFMLAHDQRLTLTLTSSLTITLPNLTVTLT